MKDRFVPALLLLLLLNLFASTSFSQSSSNEPRREGGTPPPLKMPPPPEAVPAPAKEVVSPAPATSCALAFMEKSIPLTQVLLVPHERATTLPDWKLREVELGRECAPVLDFREERQWVTELTIKEREVEEQVCCTESKPVIVKDPCTGQCRTEYQCFPVVKIVKVKVYDTVPVQREVIVRIPFLKPEERVVKGLVLDQLTVPAIETTLSAVTTHNEVKVFVPIPECILPPAPTCPHCAHDR